MEMYYEKFNMKALSFWLNMLLEAYSVTKEFPYRTESL